MLTSDPLYWKPLKPTITIKDTADNTVFYTFNGHTGAATVHTSVFPIYCSVQLSENSHGTFTIQLEDQNKTLNTTNINKGARVIIECGKQTGAANNYRLMNGLIRTTGYTRGSDNRVLYTISGSSLGIRMNERITYRVSEAAKLATGQTDITDATMKADTLLRSIINTSTESQLYDAANLATDSDVENFIPSIAIEYGELQDAVNFIEEQTNGEFYVDNNGVAKLRYQLSGISLGGRGFTIKNEYDKTVDDADDTMYLRDKSWNYDESCYKSDSYSSGLFSVLTADEGLNEDFPVWNNLVAYTGSSLNNGEIAIKFRPSHSHYLPGDFAVKSAIYADSNTAVRFRVAQDSGGSPGSVVANILFSNLTDTKGNPEVSINWNSDQTFRNTSNAEIGSFDLDTGSDYWFLVSDDNLVTSNAGPYHMWLRQGGLAQTVMTAPLNTSTNASASGSWSTASFNIFFAQPVRRSYAFHAWDPKAINAIGSGITTSGGTVIESTLPEASSTVKSRFAMAKYLVSQLYYMARPRANFNLARVTAPNIPPMPGDTIVISDTILGFSTAGSQVVNARCGDMTYTWGTMGSGSYEAPTILSINPVGIPTRYK